MPRREDIEPLLAQLGYRFRRTELLDRALTHTSFGNENPQPGRKDNERLEFLGDAVLDLVISHMLFDDYPQLQEGELTMMRARIVSERGLYRVATQLNLGEWLYLGKGEEQTGGRKKPSLLADACEALIAAVYLDGGFSAAEQVVRHLFDVEMDAPSAPGQTDHKTRLQERVQATCKETPAYRVVSESGPDHDKIFEVAVMLRDDELARATGRSKKIAEQAAAERAIADLVATAD